MCFAIPSQVVAVDGAGRATVECFGVRRTVSVALLEDAVAIGDFLLVRAGGYATERIDAERAREALELYAQMEPQLAPAAAA